MENSKPDQSAIVRIETFSDEFLCFVRATSSDGAFGWGQCSTYNADITAQILHRQVAPWALGAADGEILGLMRHVERMEHKYPGSYLCRAMAGLDTALWDLAGRRAGKPVVELLGGKPGPLRAYASSMKRDISPEAEAERLRRLCGEQGFSAAKFRIGAEMGRDVDQWPGRTEAIIALVSRALGTAVDKLVDANSAFSPQRAIEVGRMLEAHGVQHYEEPVAWWDYEGTKEVTNALKIDVTGGEQEWSVEAFSRMIAMRAVDIVQPDIMYLGGVSRAFEVARLAAEAGMPVTPHSANLSLVTLCTMHFLGAIPNAGKYLERSIEGDDYYPWQRGIFASDPFAVTDGCVLIPDRPGWGVEIQPRWLEKAHYQESALDRPRPSAYAVLYHKNLGG